MSKTRKPTPKTASEPVKEQAKPVLSIIKDIQRQTRKQYSAEEKIRIVLEGLQGEVSVAEICRREGINPNIYYRWSKEFLEAGKKRLMGDSIREATAPEVQSMKTENEAFEAIGGRIEPRESFAQKKFESRTVALKHKRMNQSEKMEVIRLVEQSELSAKATLRTLGISCASFYRWYKRYLENGYDGLADKPVTARRYWNQLPQKECARIVELALERSDLSSRELAWYITDHEGWFVSESTVYRILKKHNLITTPAYRLMEAADEFVNPTTAVNQLWQTDFTYFKIKHWGWYYLATVMDDYSRYILAWQLCSTMQATDAESTLQQAMHVAGLARGRRPRVLTDNGSAFVSKHLREYFDKKEIEHVKCAPFHPMTRGKIERYHRSMRNLLSLEHYYLPGELETRITEWVNHYNQHRYHESLDNLTPADVFGGRKEEKLLQRIKVKHQTIIKRRTDYIYQRILTP